jgi:hypothetical protein
MKSHFVPPYYQCDLRLKLQTLKQGDNDSSARFFGGLNHDIQNILDYKE